VQLTYHHSLILFIVFILLNSLDVISTAYIIHYQLGHEANPVMAFFIKHLDLPLGLILPKMLMLALVYFFVTPHPWMLVGLCLAFLVVVVSNCLLIYKSGPLRYRSGS
jgi:hypothetical protein